MAGDLQGRTAVVTGGAGGLGRAVGRALADAGVRVALADIDGHRARKAAAGIGSEVTGSETVGVEMDVADAGSVAEGMRTVEKTLGAVSLLVSSAGVCTLTPFRELTPAEWERQLSINLTGAFLCMRAAVEQMAGLGGGAIVNVGSLAGRCGGIMVSASYAASKAGMAGLTRAAAAQLARFSIRVNCVAPSTLRTEMTAGWDADALESVRRRVPLGRLGEAADVVYAVLFLLGDGARYITGVTLDVNGGLYLAP